MERGLKYIVIGVVFLLTLLPLIVVDWLFFPFITGKAFLFRILVEVGVMALLALSLFNAKYVPRFTLIGIVFGAFVGVMFLADVLGVNVTKSIWSNFERMEGWITLVHLFGAFLLFERVFAVADLWRRFLQVSLGVSVLVGIHGMLQIAGLAEIHQGGVRLDANFGNATYLAVYTLFHTFFAVLMFGTSKGVWLRVSYGAIGILNIAILYLTATRGALLGLVGGLVVAGLVYAILARSKKVGAFVVGGALMVVFLFGILVTYKESTFVTSSPALARVASISISEGQTRFRLWDIAWQGFLERPVLGWGQGNFTPVFAKFYDPDMYDQESWFDRAHNVFVDWLVAGGVFGFGLYLLLFGSMVYGIVRGAFSHFEKSVLVGVLVGYAINNLFVFDNLLSYLFFIVVGAYIASKSDWQLSLPKFSLPKEASLSLIIIGGLFILYAVNIPALNANGALLRALNGNNPLQERQAAFKEALSYGSFADQEIREQMVQVALAATRSDRVPVESKIALLVDAAVEMEQQTRLMPESARIHLLFGVTLRLLGQHEYAYEVLGKAKELAPQKQSILFEYAAAAEALGKTEEALSVYTYTHELAPEYEEARRAYEEAVLRLAK